MNEAQMERIASYKNRKNEKRAQQNQGSNTGIAFDLDTLSLIASFVYSESPLINIQSLTNIQTLMLNVRVDMSDQVKSEYVRFITTVNNKRLELGTNNRSILLTAFKGGLAGDKVGNQNFDPEYNTKELNGSEVKFINELVENCLAFLKIDVIDRLIPIITDMQEFKTTNRIHGLIDQFNDEVVNYVSTLNMSKSNLGEDPDFDSDDLEDYFKFFVKKTSESTRYLTTGCQGLNRLISGGFHNTRVYLIAGSSGIGKSLFCLNMMMQMVKHNQYTTKDPSKKPCIVYLTQENTTWETVERICSFMNLNKEDMGSITPEELTGIFRNNDSFDIETTNMTFKIVEKTAHTINTNYFYELYDNMLRNGKEMCMLIHDHVKLVNPVNYTGDKRTDLGNIVTEYKNFAKAKDLPVLTISHFNRAGSSKIKEKNSKGEVFNDNLKNLDANIINDSNLMEHNADVVVLINTEFHNGIKYMSFSRDKSRIACDNQFSYFVQPMLGNGALVEDLNEEPVYKLSLSSESINENFKISSNKTNNLELIIGSIDPDTGVTVTPEMAFKNPAKKHMTLTDVIEGYKNPPSDLDILNLCNPVKKQKQEPKPELKLLFTFEDEE